MPNEFLLITQSASLMSCSLIMSTSNSSLSSKPVADYIVRVSRNNDIGNRAVERVIRISSIYLFSVRLWRDSIDRRELRENAYVALRCSGILASTALISAGPKPVNVLLCLGRLKPGPTACSSATGTPMDGLRSRARGLDDMLSCSVVFGAERVKWESRWSNYGSELI